ncbi:MAG: ABC transporter ATP-binding protein/permease [Clostridiales bacterium]|jgi:ATP-binding cassette subfamily B protein|nr:ABC transporter ATP-binding protein/permease [Clostridiales bacterium]
MRKNPFGLTESGKKNLRTAVIACVITNITMVFPFLIIMRAVETILLPLADGSALDTGELWRLAGFGALSAAAYYAAYAFQYDKMYTAAYRESAALRTGVAERMRKLPLGFFNRKDLSELTTNIMGDCANIEHLMSHVLPQLISDAITICVLCALLAVYDWRMSLAMFSVAPVSFGIILLTRRLQEKMAEKQVAAKLDVSDRVQEYLDGIKVVKAFGLSGEKFAALESSLSKLMKQSMVFESVSGSFVSAAVMLLQAGIGFVVLVGAPLLGGGVEPVKFLTFVMISAKIYAPIIAVLTRLFEILYFAVSAKRMRALLDEPITTGDENTRLENSRIEFENVTFSYGNGGGSGTGNVIKNMSFILEPNTVTALVGASGSGKSTAARLIARFWDADGGRILIGGRDVKEVDPERLMTYMSFVFQDVVLFNDTVMNNIRIGKKDASDGDVMRAAELAHCGEFIKKMPLGYETTIGENGCTLSGGERQRISIARALLKDAPIILLDEATSSLDPENEVLVQAAISKLVGGRTVLVIAHRLRTIAGADKILVLDDGELIEEGTHAELMSRGGAYAKMVKIQRESAGWQAAK